MRRLVAFAIPVLTAAAALPAIAAPTTEGSYRVRVLPDPTVDVSPYDPCGTANAWVVATDVGGTARPIRVPAGRTLSVELIPDAAVFAGDEGTVWRLQLRAGGSEVARSSGPAWRTVAAYRAKRHEDVLIYACNRTGHPDATVTYTVR